MRCFIGVLARVGKEEGEKDGETMYLEEREPRRRVFSRWRAVCTRVGSTQGKKDKKM